MQNSTELETELERSTESCGLVINFARSRGFLINMDKLRWSEKSNLNQFKVGPSKPDHCSIDSNRR